MAKKPAHPTEKDVRLAARLMAIEYKIAEMAANLYIAGKLTMPDVKILQTAEMEMLRTRAVPGIHPAMSDHLAAEFAESVAQIHDLTRHAMEGLPAAKDGEKNETVRRRGAKKKSARKKRGGRA